MVEPMERYKPGPDFDEDGKEPLLDISLSGSKELWLIQWPLNKLKPSDINGKEIKLKFHGDGDLGSFESASGMKYDMVSSASQEPDATVFIASGSESKVVGKVARRVCLIHYPEASELEKPISRFSNSHISRESHRSSMTRSQGSSKALGSTHLYGTSHETLTSSHTRQHSTESPKHSQHKRARNSLDSPEHAGRSAGQSSRGSSPETQTTHPSKLTSPEKSHSRKSKEKKNKKVKK